MGKLADARTSHSQFTKVSRLRFRFYISATATITHDLGRKLPEALIWLWRDYDPAKTGETFEQEPAEKQKPFFRVKSLNR